MIVLLLLAVLFLAALVYTIVLVFFPPRLILRGERGQHQNLESAATEPRGSPETASEDDASQERGGMVADERGTPCHHVPGAGRGRVVLTHRLLI